MENTRVMLLNRVPTTLLLLVLQLTGLIAAIYLWLDDHVYLALFLLVVSLAGCYHFSRQIDKIYIQNNQLVLSTVFMECGRLILSDIDSITIHRMSGSWTDSHRILIKSSDDEINRGILARLEQLDIIFDALRYRKIEVTMA